MAKVVFQPSATCVCFRDSELQPSSGNLKLWLHCLTRSLVLQALTTTTHPSTVYLNPPTPIPSSQCANGWETHALYSCKVTHPIIPYPPPFHYIRVVNPWLGSWVLLPELDLWDFMKKELFFCVLLEIWIVWKWNEDQHW